VGEPFAIGFAWVVSTGSPVATLSVTGLYKGAAVVRTLALDTTFEEYALAQLFDSVSAISLTTKTGGTPATTSFALKTLQRPEEFHDVDRAPAIYSVNRPIVQTDELAEGGVSGGYSALVADETYSEERSIGRFQRIGVRDVGAGMLGPDYPDDEFFRFPGGRNRDGARFQSGPRSVRWRGIAGYQGDKTRSTTPGDIRRLFFRMLAKEWRERAFEEVELTAQSDSGGSRSKKSPKDWADEIGPEVERQRTLSFTASLDLP